MVFAKADPRVSLLYEEHLCVPELHQFGDTVRTCEPRPRPPPCPAPVQSCLLHTRGETPMQRLRILVKLLAEHRRVVLIRAGVDPGLGAAWPGLAWPAWP